MRKNLERQRRVRAFWGRRGRALAAASGLALLSCGDVAGIGQGGEAQRGAAKVGGAVVSTVDGHPIRIADIEAVVRRSSLSPREALERLQSELLLMGEAERRGVSGAAIEETAVRARVQALLDAEAAANVATDDEVRAAYERDPRFHKLERRASIHVLARVKRTAKREELEAARAVAAAAVPDLERLSFEELSARYSGKIGSVAVKAEKLLPYDRNAQLAPEYREALFSLEAQGVVREPVQTNFGWHVIRVTEILPEEHTPYEEAAPALREEISLKKQADAVKHLLEDLRRAHLVEVTNDVDDKLAVVDGAEEVVGQ